MYGKCACVVYSRFLYIALLLEACQWVLNVVCTPCKLLVTKLGVNIITNENCPGAHSLFRAPRSGDDPNLPSLRRHVFVVALSKLVFGNGRRCLKQDPVS